MIRRTFLFLPSIGPGTERTLWRRGVSDWSDFLGRERLEGFSAKRKVGLDEQLHQAIHFFERRETAYFRSALPTREHWRLFDCVREGTAYLDIETDGLGPGAVTTVVGVHRNGRTLTLVRGIDLTSENLAKALEGTKLLVTFNGASFDVPILEREFPFTMPQVPHFDLRHGCARIGLTGGLKAIERRIGIARAEEVEYVTGEQAVYLWHLWERKGKENALRLLCQYNEEDTRNLEIIAPMVYEKLMKCTLECANHG